MDEEVLGALTWAQACHAVQQTFQRSSYSANLVNRLSVITNVLIGTLSRLPLWRTLTFRFPEEERPLAIVALQRVGIADWAFQPAANLSGGQQQRAAIARAMMQRAQLVLADEPIASLDPEAARRVMESLAELNHIDGVTVLVSLHQVQFAMPAGAQWAEPDIGHAADCLRLLAGDAGPRSRLRTKARERAERQFSLDRFREVAAGLLPAPASIQRV